MARPRTATNILDARGAFRKDPQRARPDEPKGTGKFRKSAPKHMGEEERAAWRLLVKLIPGGVLTGSDVLALEVMAVLFAEFRRIGAKMSAANLARMTALMGRFGLDPSGRASLVVPQAETNPYDDV